MYSFKLRKRIHFSFLQLNQKKIIRINDIHFVEKRSHFVNLEEKIEIHEPSNKYQRLFISTFVIKKTLNKQRIIILSDAELIISIKSSNRLSSTNIRSSLIVNRF